MSSLSLGALSLSIVLLAVAIAFRAAGAEPGTPPAGAAGAKDRLAVVWSSADPDVAHQVCLMYAHAAGKHKWFDEVRLVVWGPSAKLLAEDDEIQKKVKAMMADGIRVEACVVCARNLKSDKALADLGVDIRPMGKPLSEYLKDDWKVLTY